MRIDGVDLTNFINAEPTWTKVAKGYRSTTRRARKLVAKNTITAKVADMSNKSVEYQGDTVSEKLGGAVHGRRFAVKEEHVPIKKRRYLFHSPSPSPPDNRSSPICITQEQLVQIAKPSNRSGVVVDGNGLEVLDERHSCNGHDKLFGTDKLADVARDSQMCGDIDILPATNNKLVEEPAQINNPSTVCCPAESQSSLSRISAVTQMDTVQEGGTESDASQDHCVNQDIAPQNNPITVPNNPSSYKHNGFATEAQNGTRLDKDFADKSGRQDDSQDNVTSANECKGTAQLICQKSPVFVSDKSSGKECSQNPRLHWDLNLPLEAWDGPDNLGDHASQRDVGEFSKDDHTKKPCGDNHNDHIDRTVTPNRHKSFLMSSERNSDLDGQIAGEFQSSNEVEIQNVKLGEEAYGQIAGEFQSGNEVQIQNVKLGEEANIPERSDGDSEKIEAMNYESEPEDEIIDSSCETVVNKVENVDKGSVSGLVCGSRSSESFSSVDASRMKTTELDDAKAVEKHAAVHTNDFSVEGLSKGLLLKADKREFTSHDGMQRRRSGVHGPYNNRHVDLSTFMGMDRSGLDTRGRNPWNSRFGYWDKDSIRPNNPHINSNESSNWDRCRPITIPRTNTQREKFFHGPPRNWFRSPEVLNRTKPDEYLCDISRRHMSNRGESSNSPIIRKQDYSHTYRKESSSHSPTTWRQENRSPNFMGRERFSIHQRFPGNDYEMGFVSRGSLLDTRRWYQPRNEVPDEDMGIRNSRFSERMMSCPDRRFDSGECMRRVNSETHFNKPMMHHRRFFNGGNDRSCTYEGRIEDKKGE